MQRPRTRWTLLLALLLFAATAKAETHIVKLTDQPPYVHPLVLEAKVGDTVMWQNTGPELVHTVIDEGLLLFSDDIEIGSDWTHEFTKPGVFPYLCFRHNFMRGTVVVRDADGSTETRPDFPYQLAFKEYVIPTHKAVPRMVIASHVDDSIWFTEGGGDFYGFEDIPAQNKVGRLTPKGQIVEYATPTPDGDGSKVAVDSLVMDAEGQVWFTERLTNRIGRLDQSGRITEVQLPDPEGGALGIDLDDQGRVWFAQRNANKIGYLEPGSQKLVEIELPEADSEPRTIFLDSRRRAWYTARTANEIGYYDLDTGEIIRLKIPTKLARPTGIAETSDGTIWFVQMVGNKLAKVVGDQIVEYPLPTPHSAPFKLVADQDDHLWITQVFGNSIAHFDPEALEFTEYKIPTVDSRPGGIDVDRFGRVWFTQQMGNKIGMFDPQLARSIAQQEEQRSLQEGVPAAASAPAPTNSPEPDAAPAEGTSRPATAITGRAAPLPEHFEIEDFEIPTPGSGPGNHLIEDDEGWLWFNQIYGNSIGAFNIHSHQFKEFKLPGFSKMPVGLVRDQEGMLWATLFQGNALARLDPRQGVIREFRTGQDAALPAGMTLDPQGEVWFTQLGANRIARFDAATETFDEYPMPRKDSSPLMIFSDGDGSLWISASEESGNYVARFDLESKTFEVFDLPTEDASPTGILTTDEGLWVAQGGSGKIAWLDFAEGGWQEFQIPADDAQPVNLARDGAGRIWITDGGGLGGVGGNRLAVFDPVSREFRLIPMKIKGAKPRGILAASDGNIWFTQQNANLLSRLELGGS
jgi:streptogramin lyase/plastocyanin